MVTTVSVPNLPLTAFGNVVDVQAFGIVGGVDETTKFETMRQYLLTHPGSTVVFQPNTTYKYMSPKWAAGVKDLTIWAVGASFQNLSMGTNGGSDMNTALYLGSGPITHSMTTGNVIDGAGNPLGGITATGGHPIENVAIGDTVVTFSTIGNAATYEVGDNVCLHWFYRQAASYPPNPGYWEYNKVLTVNTGAGTITLANPTKNAYKKQAPDTTHYTVSCGAARCINLNRSDYQIAERVVLIGGTGLLFGSGSNLYDAQLEICGALDVEVRGVNFRGTFPTMVRNVDVYASQFWGSSELDKIIDRIRYFDCDIASPSQGTGVDVWEMRGGRITGTFQQRSRKFLADGVTFLSQGAGGSAYQMLHDQYPSELVEFRNCNFFPNSSQLSSVLPGNLIPFTPDALTTTSMTINFANAAFATMVRSIEIGQKITPNTGAQMDVFTITDFSFDVSNNLILTGYHNVVTPALVSVARNLWFSKRVVFDDSNKTLPIPTKHWDPVSSYHRAWNQSPLRGGEAVYKWRERYAYAVNYAINGVLNYVSVNVLKPYSGADAGAVVLPSTLGPGSAWSGITVNAKTAGLREFFPASTLGALTGDTLVAIGSNRWVETMTLQLQKAGGPTGTFTDASEEALPLVEITARISLG